MFKSRPEHCFPNLNMLDSNAFREHMFTQYLDGLRSEATRRNYYYGIKWIVKDPEQFLELARKDRWAAEDRVIESIRQESQNVAPATLRNPVVALKSFLQFYEVDLNWKRINSVLPKGRKIAIDRGPTLEEIRKLLSICDMRMKCVVLILASSGIRVGAFNELKIKHYLVPLGTNLGRLRVYAGSSKEYWAFLSFECVEALNDYFEARRSIGEKLTPESPLIRDKWNIENRREKIDPANAKPLTGKAIANRLNVLWVKAGVRSFNSKEGYERGEFQQVHGFRKFFKIQAGQAVRNRDDVEVLMGHTLSHHKPSLAHLEDEYRNAIPFITISEAKQIKMQAEVKGKQHQEDLQDLKLILFEKDEQIKKMQSQISELEKKTFRWKNFEDRIMDRLIKLGLASNIFEKKIGAGKPLHIKKNNEARKNDEKLIRNILRSLNDKDEDKFRTAFGQD